MNYRARDSAQLDRIERHVAAISFGPRVRLSLLKLVAISIFCVVAGLYLAIGIGLLHDHFFPPPSPPAASQPHHHHTTERTR